MARRICWKSFVQQNFPIFDTLTVETLLVPYLPVTLQIVREIPITSVSYCKCILITYILTENDTFHSPIAETKACFFLALNGEMCRMKRCSIYLQNIGVSSNMTRENSKIAHSYTKYILISPDFRLISYDYIICTCFRHLLLSQMTKITKFVYTSLLTDNHKTNDSLFEYAFIMKIRNCLRHCFWRLPPTLAALMCHMCVYSRSFSNPRWVSLKCTLFLPRKEDEPCLYPCHVAPRRSIGSGLESVLVFNGYIRTQTSMFSQAFIP